MAFGHESAVYRVPTMSSLQNHPKKTRYHPGNKATQASRAIRRGYVGHVHTWDQSNGFLVSFAVEDSDRLLHECGYSQLFDSGTIVSMPARITSVTKVALNTRLTRNRRGFSGTAALLSSPSQLFMVIPEYY